MKLPWTRKRPPWTEQEKRGWIVTARLAGVALALAEILVWTLGRRYWF
jgi:hypothetical protein